MKKIIKLVSVMLCLSVFCGCNSITPATKEQKGNIDKTVQSVNDNGILEKQTDSAVVTSGITDNSVISSETSNSSTGQAAEAKKSTTIKVPSINTYPNNYHTLNFNTVQAVWLSYLELDSQIWGKSSSQFTSYITQVCNNMKSLGLNTIYVQVRSHGNAYYQSSNFPWGSSGSGAKSNPGYDPLKIMVDTAHSKGISIHAWINPFRLMSDSHMDGIGDSYAIKQWYKSSNGTRVVKVDKLNYLNPAYDEARQLICNGVAEIVSNYKVDGIQIDDYFYPSTDVSFDEEAFKASGSSDLKSWRLNNVNNIVASMYRTVKKYNSKALFGISPQGNINNNYSSQYADVKKWCSDSGYVDYIIPQIYWDDSTAQKYFTTRVNEWNGIVKNKNIKLVIGLAPYKTCGSQKTFPDGTMALQVAQSRKLGNYSGISFFRYDHLFGSEANSNEITELKKIMT